MAERGIGEDLLELVAGRALKHKESIYYFAQSFNALCKLDLKTGRAKVVTGILGERFEEKNLVRALMAYKDKVLCIPKAAKQIYMINLESGKEVGRIRPQKEKPDKGANYFNVYLRDNFCYLFPYYGDEMFLLDLEEKKVIKTVNVKEKYRNISGLNYESFSLSGCYAFEHKLYMVMEYNAVIAEFDICSMEFFFHEIEGTNGYYVFLAGAGSCLYILDNEGKIRIWDIKSHSVKSSLQLELMEGKKKHFFHYSAREGEYLYMFKAIPSNIYIRIYLETNQIECRSFQEDFGAAAANGEPLQYVVKDEESFFFLSGKQELYRINFDSKEVKVLSLTIDPENVHEYLKLQERELYERTSEFALEGRYVWTLENLIEKCVHVPYEEDKHIGADIYQYSKEELKQRE